MEALGRENTERIHFKLVRFFFVPNNCLKAQYVRDFTDPQQSFPYLWFYQSNAKWTTFYSLTYVFIGTHNQQNMGKLKVFKTWFQNSICKRNRFLIWSLVSVCEWFHKTWTPQNFSLELHKWLFSSSFSHGRRASSDYPWGCFVLARELWTDGFFQIKHGIFFLMLDDFRARQA